MAESLQIEEPNSATGQSPTPQRPTPKPATSGKMPDLTLGNAYKIIQFYQEEPEWLADPRTRHAAEADFGQASKIIGLNLQIERAAAQGEAARAKTLAGQSATKDLVAFQKGMDAILPEDRAELRTMKYNEDGSVSRAQWEFLGLAERTARTRKENERMMAEIEALQSGAKMTTTVSDKGVTRTFRPESATAEAKEAALNATPETRTLANGMTLAWMPGGKGIHVIKPDKNTDELTPAQLISLARSIQISDPNSKVPKQIGDFLAQKVAGQISGTNAPATSAPATLDLRPDDPAKRIIGKRYRSPSGKTATWTSAGWQE